MKKSIFSMLLAALFIFSPAIADNMKVNYHVPNNLTLMDQLAIAT
jgi:hypothetical protein